MDTYSTRILLEQINQKSGITTTSVQTWMEELAKANALIDYTFQRNTTNKIDEVYVCY